MRRPHGTHGAAQVALIERVAFDLVRVPCARNPVSACVVCCTAYQYPHRPLSVGHLACACGGGAVRGRDARAHAVVLSQLGAPVCAIALRCLREAFTRRAPNGMYPLVTVVERLGRVLDPAGFAGWSCQGLDVMDLLEKKEGARRR